jgi:hypothetical protein
MLLPEQEAERKAPAIRSPALQNEQRSSGGVHARDLARNAPLDHPEGLAEKGQIAPSVRRARGVRGGGRTWRCRQAASPVILLREAPERRGTCWRPLPALSTQAQPPSHETQVGREIAIRRFSDAVATSREGHHQRGSRRAGPHRRWDREPLRALHK